MYKVLITFLMMAMSHFSAVRAENPDFLFLTGQAAQAPSGHNTQPWRFRIGESSIGIVPDYDKALPVVDPRNRELFISLGCALENLCIAASAKGYDYRTDIMQTGEITVHLTPGEPSAESHALLSQIPRRQTNRSVYSGETIPQQTLEELRQMPCEAHIRIHFYANGTTPFDTLRNYVEQGNRIQMRDRAFRQELKEWMRYNKRHSERTGNGLSYAVFGAPNLPRFLSQPIIGMAIGEKSQVRGDNRRIGSASHLVLFTTESDTPEGWIGLGRTLQRFLLRTTAEGIAHSYFNQPNEVRSLSIRMAGSLGLAGEYPAILIRIGYGEPMPYSKREPIQSLILP